MKWIGILIGMLNIFHSLYGQLDKYPYVIQVNVDTFLFITENGHYLENYPVDSVFGWRDSLSFGGEGMAAFYKKNDKKLYFSTTPILHIANFEFKMSSTFIYVVDNLKNINEIAILDSATDGSSWQGSNIINIDSTIYIFFTGFNNYERQKYLYCKIMDDRIVKIGYRDTTKRSEAMKCIRHCNGRDWWVLNFDHTFNHLFTYLVTNDTVLEKSYYNFNNINLIDTNFYFIGNISYEKINSRILLSAFNTKNKILNLYNFNRKNSSLNFVYNLFNIETLNNQLNQNNYIYTSSLVFLDSNNLIINFQNKNYDNSTFWIDLRQYDYFKIEHDLQNRNTKGYLTFYYFFDKLFFQTLNYHIYANYGKNIFKILNIDDLKFNQVILASNFDTILSKNLCIPCNFSNPTFADHNLPPDMKIGFSYQVPDCQSSNILEVSFTDTSCCHFYRIWDFGDGTVLDTLWVTQHAEWLGKVDTFQTVTHTYNRPGRYKVKLKILNPYNGEHLPPGEFLMDSLEQWIVVPDCIYPNVEVQDTLCVEDTLKLKYTGTNNYDTLWVDFGNRSYTWNGQQALWITPEEAGQYRLRVHAYNSTFDTVWVYPNEIVVLDCDELWIPNAFTPNNDGMNDVFGYVCRNCVWHSLEIFNRDTQPIFRCEGSEACVWMGKTNKGFVPEGVYVYRLKVRKRDGRFVERVGTVTVMR